MYHISLVIGQGINRHLTNRQVSNVPAMVVVFALIAAVIITYNDGSDNYGPSIYCYYGPMFGLIDL